MKIGILTLTLHTNYGGIIQAYALQTVLKRMQHDVRVIYKPLREDEHKPFMILRYLKRGFLKIILKKHVSVFSEKRWNQRQTNSETYTSQFIYNHLNLFKIKSFNDIKPNDFDCIIVGSDQVWRPQYFKEQYKTEIENAFLSFTKGWDIKRFSYAASFGTDVWEYDEKETIICKELLSHFDSVSVRENSGLRLCENHLNKNAQCVLDPTFLLEETDYLKIMAPKSSNGNLMVYVLDKNEDLDSLVKLIKTKEKLVPFYPNKPNPSDINQKKGAKPPIENWLKGFRDAKLVVTDSYHACVFSIILKIPFVVIGNKTRGYTRFQHLLSMFNLEYRLIESSSQFNSRLLEPLPDSLYKDLEFKKVESYNFIKNSLL